MPSAASRGADAGTRQNQDSPGSLLDGQGHEEAD
jgi:hypothetical protein